MIASDRNRMLYVLAQNYVLDKNNSKVFGRESSASYYHSLGMLQGACMAFECDINETDTQIDIVTRKGKRLVTFDLKGEKT